MLKVYQSYCAICTKGENKRVKRYTEKITVLYKDNKCITSVLVLLVHSQTVATVTPTNKHQKVVHIVIHLYTLYDKMDSITKQKNKNIKKLDNTILCSLFYDYLNFSRLEETGELSDNLIKWG